MDPCTRTPSSDAAPPRQSWRLQRNCALTPTQSLLGWLPLLLVLSAVTVFGAALGYAWIGGFALLTLLGCTAAVLVHARHALDGDTVVVRSCRIEVESRCGSDTRRIELDACWTRVAFTPDSDCVTLRCCGTSVPVGRELPQPRRQRFARELAAVLAQGRSTAASPLFVSSR